LFGSFLIFTGYKIVRQGNTQVDPNRNPVVRIFQRAIPMVTEYRGARFIIRQNGRLLATPLALVLVTVETTDVVFAVDSIPAIFAVSRDPFIVFTSNICAILGLRSMYFVLAAAVGRLVYLNVGLGIVLAFVGVKMLLSNIYKIPIGLSLGIVAAVLLGSALFSLVHPPKTESPPPSPPSAEASIPEPPLLTSPPDET
jgi:tellurite resistance protein TerC